MYILKQWNYWNSKETHQDTDISKSFLHWTMKVQATKAKLSKLEAKETVNCGKKQWSKLTISPGEKSVILLNISYISFPKNIISVRLPNNPNSSSNHTAPSFLIFFFLFLFEGKFAFIYKERDLFLGIS